MVKSYGELLSNDLISSYSDPEPTRTLTDDEIVESVMDSTGQVLWTIHKPIRGWYLVIRSPSYTNPRTHIALQPLKLRGPTHEDRFIFRLSPIHLPSTSTSSSSPTTDVNSPPTASNMSTRASSSSQTTSHSPLRSSDPFINPGSAHRHNLKRASTTSHNIHAPQIVISSSTSTNSTDPTSEDEFPTADGHVALRLPSSELSNLDDSSHSNTHPTPNPINSDEPTMEIDFLLQPLTPAIPLSTFGRLISFFGETDRSFCCTRPGSASVVENIMSYEDETSMFNLSTKGQLKVRFEALSQYGMPVCFWITIALAYLGFRGDKEAYQAATEDIQ
ncbi:hypothetical protein DFH28DRAFT_951617 [Melampsora americana]|nr:hypothetical protein DFH28DRAFT_951617 [Melampsora americana]